MPVTIGYSRQSLKTGGNPMAISNPEINDLQWQKARRSVNNGACVEVASVSRQIFVRDSQDQNGPTMRYSKASWKVFLADVKKDQFDLVQS
jgi:Domain of unknown function (DUF397)